MLEWLPGTHAALTAGIGVFILIVAVVSAVLTSLYAFQQEDWRTLLSFSSAENASIAVAMLGAALIFRGDGNANSRAWHGRLRFCTWPGTRLPRADCSSPPMAFTGATGGYTIFHSDLLRRSSWVFGLGALFAAMSLAAMPPQAGFVSEWYVFQTVFQGFHLGTLPSRLVMALAGAGLALTAAIAFATFVKVSASGCLDARRELSSPYRAAYGLSSACSDLRSLRSPSACRSGSTGSRGAVSGQFGTNAAREMHDGLLLVPLTAKFAFISPTLFVVVMPLLALCPDCPLIANRRYAVRRVPVWYGGFDQDPERASTTALTFSNAMRTFYSFIYRPTEESRSEARGGRYFVHRLVFTHEVAPIFGRYLFAPVTRAVFALADKLRALQSGQLNFYLAVLGVLLVLILALTLY